jgi:hypothetical protein
LESCASNDFEKEKRDPSVKVTKFYNSALFHTATPFVAAEKTTPTPVIGLLRSRKY